MPANVDLNHNVSSIDRRTGIGSGAIALGELIYDLTHDYRNAYDPDIDNFCVIHTDTTSGGSCTATIACDDDIGGGNWQDVELRPGPGVGTDTWNVCYLNGRQYFYHEKVGDFSITYTQAGGINSDRDGLHNPILQFAHIDNWAPIDAQADSDIDEDSGHLCKSFEVSGTERIEAECGVPQIGNGDFGITNTPDTHDDYVPGTCGLHFIQYQIPEGDDNYSFAIRVVDHDGNLIGQVGDSYAIDSDKVDATDPINVESALPYVVVATVVKPGEVEDTDDAPVQFAYSDQSWDSNSDQCSIGAYDSGSRQGDCVFSC